LDFLNKAKNNSYIAPEAIFNLDGTDSHKTIHDQQQKAKQLVKPILPGRPSCGSKANGKKLDVENLLDSSSDNDSQDSASQSRESIGNVQGSRSKGSSKESTSSSDMKPQAWPMADSQH
jgi:hypothetical protein